MSTPNIHSVKTGVYLPAYMIITLVLIVSTITSCVARQKRYPKQSRQMQQLLKEKQDRTAVQRKIDSRLLQALKEYKGQKIADGAGLEPANVYADTNGNLAVDISATVSDSLLNHIRALGGQIIFPSKEYHTIRAQIHLSKVETIAAYQAVTFIQPAAQAANNGAAPATPGILHPLPVKEAADTLPYRQ